MTTVPLVDYLELGDHPHLIANECTSCSARFFNRRNGCAKCGGTSFKRVDVATEGVVRAFTIVSFAAPGVPVPFVSAIIDCDGSTVQANLVNVAPDPATLRTGMQVSLTTFPMGKDSVGDEAVAFGFEPAGDHDEQGAAQ